MIYVLLVEDEEGVAELLKAVMEANGYRVFWVASVEKAMTLLKGIRFSAVVTDHHMPGKLTGLDLAKHVLENYPGTHVSLISGGLEPDKCPKEIDFLGKPFSSAALLATLPKPPSQTN